MHAKAVKMRAKIKDQQKKTIKQSMFSPTRHGFPQWSCYPVAGARAPRRHLATAEATFRASCCEVLCVGKGLGFNHKIMINVLGVVT